MIKASIDWRKAATEFVVIVVGVLAALAVDQWRDDRNDRATEAEYLGRLKSDLNADLVQFARFEKVFETKARVVTQLRNLGLSELMALDHQQLMDNLVLSSFTGLTAAQSTTFDELQSTGRLALIQDVQLRDALSGYYTLHAQLTDILIQGHGGYMRLWQESMPGELIYQWRLSKTLTSLDDLRVGLDEITSSPDLQAASNAEITYAASLVLYHRMFQQDARELLALLGDD